MRSKFAAAGVALAAFVLVAAVAAAAAKPNFAGTWVLDASKSEGGGAPGGGAGGGGGGGGMGGGGGATSETMTVKQDGDKIDVERKITTPRGDRTQSDTYAADGKEGEFTMQMRQNPVKGKRTAKWSADGSTLEVSDKADIQTPDGNTMTMQTSSKWTLSGDGKTLTVEQTRTTPNGEQKSKRVYNKQ
ncbi:MAG: hypothetical protein ACJ741_12655 [Pyrinomonadaceae bacterium]